MGANVVVSLDMRTPKQSKAQAADDGGPGAHKAEGGQAPPRQIHDSRQTCGGVPWVCSSRLPPSRRRRLENAGTAIASVTGGGASLVPNDNVAPPIPGRLESTRVPR